MVKSKQSDAPAGPPKQAVGGVEKAVAKRAPNVLKESKQTTKHEIDDIFSLATGKARSREAGIENASNSRKSGESTEKHVRSEEDACMQVCRVLMRISS